MGQAGVIHTPPGLNPRQEQAYIQRYKTGGAAGAMKLLESWKNTGGTRSTTTTPPVTDPATTDTAAVTPPDYLGPRQKAEWQRLMSTKGQAAADAAVAAWKKRGVLPKQRAEVQGKKAGADQVLKDGSVGDLAQEFMKSFMGSGDWATEQKRYEDAAYADLTQNTERDKAREMEAQKQELANRGLPYTPGDTESAYGSAIQGIDEKYKSYQDQARLKAVQMGQSNMASNADINSKMFNDWLAKYGIDKNAMTAKQVAEINKRRTGGGGAPATNDVSVNGYPAGFGV